MTTYNIVVTNPAPVPAQATVAQVLGQPATTDTPAVTYLTRAQLAAVLEAAAPAFTGAGSATYADDRGRPDPACPVQVVGLPRAVLRRCGDVQAVIRFGTTCLRLSSEHAGPRAPYALLVELGRVLGADVVAAAVVNSAVLNDSGSGCSDLYLAGITLEGEPREPEPCCAHPLSIHGVDGCWYGWGVKDNGCPCATPGLADR